MHIIIFNKYFYVQGQKKVIYFEHGIEKKDTIGRIWSEDKNGDLFFKKNKNTVIDGIVQYGGSRDYSDFHSKNKKYPCKFIFVSDDENYDHLIILKK